MRVFIDFWKLETENSILHIFNFLHNEFWDQFFFLVHFGLPYKFFSLKNRKLFLETENKGKKQLPNIPYYFLSLNFWVFYLTKENGLSYRSNWVGLLMGRPKRATSELGQSSSGSSWSSYELTRAFPYTWKNKVIIVVIIIDNR